MNSPKRIQGLTKSRSSENFTYGIVADNNLQIDDYVVALEAVVKK